MKPRSLKLTDPAEAAAVDQVVVRLIEPRKKARWEPLVYEHPYLKHPERKLRARQVAGRGTVDPAP